MTHKATKRRGAATVEFAMTCGLAFLFFFAAFEFCRAAMVRHGVDDAVYEATRTGVVPGASAADVEASANAILATVGIRDADVEVTPDPINPDDAEVTVRISAPMDSNGFLAPIFLRGMRIERNLTMQREGIF